MKTLFLMCAFLLGLTCSAQSFNAKDLVGTQWEDIQGEDEYASETLEFSTTNMTLTIRYKSGGRTVTLNNQYYLSDTIPSIFEEQKVGKNTIGKYLVYYVKKKKHVVLLYNHKVYGQSSYFASQKDSRHYRRTNCYL